MTMTMRPPVIPLALAAVFAALAACTETDRYPITGEECTPGDAVQTFGRADCPPAR